MIDYIPRKDSELVAWSANFTAQVSAHAPEWEITPDEVAALEAADSAFSSLYTQVDTPAKNPIIVREKDIARAALVAKIRELAGFRLKNPVITPAQRVAMGLHVRRTTYTRHPPPATRPEIHIEVLDVRRLKVVFRDMDRESKAKPAGVIGAVIRYAVLDAPPAGPDVLPCNMLVTRTPYVLSFAEAERGKTVYIAICWQNRRGQQGPWSKIESAIVP